MALWLLLLSIVTHAFAPVDFLGQGSGSAFSAASVDVAVAPPEAQFVNKTVQDRPRGFGGPDAPGLPHFVVVASEAITGLVAGHSAGGPAFAIPVLRAGVAFLAQRAPPSA